MGSRTAFPISVDFDAFSLRAQDTEVEKEMANIKLSLGLHGETIGVGIERFDYTKGIPDRFRAIDRFFEKNPHI
jgi:trehalose 6-phosphate synthase